MWSHVLAGITRAAGAGETRDGPGDQARFGGPLGVAVDAQGNVHVADHHNGTIRKVSVAGGYPLSWARLSWWTARPTAQAPVRISPLPPG